jgi:hypothetical protein
MDAIFKEKNLIKSKNIQEAFEFINSVLPRNMRIQMQARFVANGYSVKDSAKGVADVIGAALMSGNDIKSSYGLDFDTNMNKAAGTKAS